MKRPEEECPSDELTLKWERYASCASASRKADTGPATSIRRDRVLLRYDLGQYVNRLSDRNTRPRRTSKASRATLSEQLETAQYPRIVLRT